MKQKATQYHDILIGNNLLLMFGALLALTMANMFGHLYHEIETAKVFGISLHFIANDTLMAFFFALAAKEVWEAIILVDGALHDPKKALIPIFATIGGVTGPIIVYLVLSAITGNYEALSRGWAIPTATDIAFSAMIAKFIFGKAVNTSVTFLMVIAIIDDGIGVVIIAIFYPQGDIQLQWLLLSVIGVIIGIYMNKQKVHNHWWYFFLVGLPSFIGFLQAGIHPAMGLIPMIPTMPHAQSDAGIYAKEELKRHDTLNEFEHFWKTPVQYFLFLFGFFNAGVQINNVNDATFIVAGALLIGKTCGVFSMGYLAAKMFGGLPKGMTIWHLFVVAILTSIGFTVVLFVAGVGLPAGPLQDGAKIGALISLTFGVFAVIVAKLKGIQPDNSSVTSHSHAYTH